MKYWIDDKQLEEAYKLKQMSDHELAAWMNEILQQPIDEPTVKESLTVEPERWEWINKRDMSNWDIKWRNKTQGIEEAFIDVFRNLPKQRRAKNKLFLDIGRLIW